MSDPIWQCDPDLHASISAAIHMCVVDFIGLLYMAYPNGCQHNITFLLRLRPYPVRGIGSCNCATIHISMSAKDDPNTQQGNDSFDLVWWKCIRSCWDGQLLGSRNATSFVEPYMSEVQIALPIQFGDWDQALLLEMHRVHQLRSRLCESSLVTVHLCKCYVTWCGVNRASAT